MTVIDDIKSNNFIAGEQQIEQLSWQHCISLDDIKKSSGTYLSVLIAMTQSYGNDDALTALEVTHKMIYPAVMRGIEKAGFTGKEADKKATFARTSASTLRGYLRLGNDIHALEPGDTSKRMLRQPSEINTPKLQRTEQRLIASLRALAKTDEEGAILKIDAHIASLKALRKKLRGSVSVVSHSLKRTQHQPHAVAH